ncbi:MAG: hypothetical protein ABIK89_24755, partial [Planctomycetota bacterium]
EPEAFRWDVLGKPQSRDVPHPSEDRILPSGFFGREVAGPFPGADNVGTSAPEADLQKPAR